jgi:putative flippase GtrA
LNLFHGGLKWNLYVSNLLAIVMVTFWNFGMNARFNWRITAGRESRSTVSQYQALEKK